MKVKVSIRLLKELNDKLLKEAKKRLTTKTEVIKDIIRKYFEEGK